MDLSSIAFNTMLQMPALDEVAFLDCVEGAITDPEVLAIEDPECACEQSTYWATYFGANCPEVNVMYWYHPDYLGSVEAVTDINGEVYQFFHNTIWGEPLQQQKAFLYNSFSSRYRFNGKERDWESGNFYYGARYYDPKISVWLSVDPILKHHESTYSFTSNNPIMLIDPDGRDTTGAFDSHKGLKKVFDYTYTYVSGRAKKYDRQIKRIEDKARNSDGIIDYSKLSDRQMRRLERKVGKWKKWNDIKSDFDEAINSDIKVTFNTYISNQNAGETGWYYSGVRVALEWKSVDAENIANLIHEMSHVGELLLKGGKMKGSIGSEFKAYKKMQTYYPEYVDEFIDENGGHGSLIEAIYNAYPEYDMRILSNAYFKR